MKLPLVVLAVLPVGSVVYGHGVPILISSDGSRLYSPSVVEAVVLEDDGFEVYASEPGFGVGLEGTAPPAGVPLGLETDSGLLYWSGAQFDETDAVLTIEAPSFDSLGNANQTPVDRYEVRSLSGPQSGMVWSTYPGGGFWDAHGAYVLQGADGSTPGSGLYGVALRVVDQSAAPLLPSDTFVLPLVFDPGGSLSDQEIADGRAAFDALLSSFEAGDYDRDGDIDSADYDTWRATYGTTLAPGEGADGDHDGRVTAADYTVWRDAAQGAAVAVPEPGALVVALALTSAALSRRQPIDLPQSDS